MKEKESCFAFSEFFFISLLSRHAKCLFSLVVLPSQSRHDDGQELLEGGLDLRSELVAHLGGDDDGQAVRQQL